MYEVSVAAVFAMQTWATERDRFACAGFATLLGLGPPPPSAVGGWVVLWAIFNGSSQSCATSSGPTCSSHRASARTNCRGQNTLGLHSHRT